MSPSKISVYIYSRNCHIFMYCGVFYQCSTRKSFFFQSPTRPWTRPQHACEKEIWWNFAKLQSVHRCGKTAFIFFHSIFHNPNLYTTYSTYVYLSSPFFVTQAHILWSYVFPNGELSKTPNSTPQTRFCQAAYSCQFHECGAPWVFLTLKYANFLWLWKHVELPPRTPSSGCH